MGSMARRQTWGGVCQALGSRYSLPAPALVAFSVAFARLRTCGVQAGPTAFVDADATKVFYHAASRERAHYEFPYLVAAAVAHGVNRTQRRATVGTDLPRLWKEGRPGGHDF